MNHPIATLMLAIGTITSLGCTALPVQAGHLADIAVVLQRTGERLPVYEHQGQRWIEGRPGERYAVELRNRSGGRVLTVLSVDGVNAITGQTAGAQQSGYVLAPRERAAIAGWRKSDQEVAAFYFTALPDSYAARTGRPDHVGVIGLAVFREKPPVPQTRYSYESIASKAERSNAPAPATAAAQGALADSANEAGAARLEKKLGTGHGERLDAPIEVTRFERASSQPSEIIALRYDSRANLIALGVIPRPLAALPPPPRPFPAESFVPDPS